ncbi:MAG: universal stress protein [Terriglobales bacterium]
MTNCTRSSMGTAQIRTAAILADRVPRPSSVSLSNVLVATDFSPCSEAALRFAAALTRQQRGKVSLFHCLSLEPGFPKPMQATLPGIAGDENIAAIRMYQSLSQAEFADIATETIVGRGELWPVLEATTRQYGIDAIAVGTRGRDGFKKLLLGSVSEQIFRHSTLPVLTVGPRADPACLLDGGFRRVLYATDLLPSSLHGLAYAVALARQNLVLLHVLCSDLASGEYGATTFDDGDFFKKREQLRRLVPADLEADAIVESGLPASTILRVANEQNASVIVMGVNPSSAFAATHLPWATAHRVILEAHCPVLTVR